MTPTLVAGASMRSPEIEIAQQSEPPVLLRYARPKPAASSYAIPLFGPRLTVVVSLGDSGWIAQACELDALGYGSSYTSAINHLTDAVEEYLEFLREDQPRFAEEVAHHADYVELLDTPRELWFASVTINAASVE